MQLRDHPLMRFYNIPNWPPIWTTAHQENRPAPKGEVGILEYVLMNDLFAHKIYLLMSVDGRRYVACISFQDKTFCRYVEGLLKNNIGRSIKEIGDLDVSYTL